MKKYYPNQKISTDLNDLPKVQDRRILTSVFVVGGKPSSILFRET